MVPLILGNIHIAVECCWEVWCRVWASEPIARPETLTSKTLVGSRIFKSRGSSLAHLAAPGAWQRARLSVSALPTT